MKIVLMVMALAITTASIAEVAQPDRYPGPWRDESNVLISKALVQNSIKGCGEFKYRPSSKNKGEFLVYCTRDGKNWVAYLVWAPVGKVTGPHQISAAIPP